MIVVIGSNWLDSFAKRAPENDQVLWEIETALARKLNILPVLISKSVMPSKEQLPESINQLADFNALSVHATDSLEFNNALDKIVFAVEKSSRSLMGVAPVGLGQFLNMRADMLSRYSKQQDILTVFPDGGDPVRIPAVEVLNAANGVDESQIEICFDETPFELTLCSTVAFDVYAKDARSRGRKFYSTDTARLKNVNVDLNGRLRLEFQLAEYFDYVKTNMAMDFIDPMGESLRDEVHPDGQLEPLNKSHLANHTGISGLVFSNDGKMIIQRRGSQVLTNPNQLCPGYSGVLNANDIRHGLRHDEVSSLSQVDVLRELHEELGVSSRKIINRSFMGLSRELLRGGKPELFYAVDVGMSAEEILACYPKELEGNIIQVPMRFARSRLSLEESCYYRDRFDKLVNQLLEAGGGLLSAPLLTNLALWINQNMPARNLKNSSV